MQEPEQLHCFPLRSQVHWKGPGSETEQPGLQRLCGRLDSLYHNVGLPAVSWCSLYVTVVGTLVNAVVKGGASSPPRCLRSHFLSVNLELPNCFWQLLTDPWFTCAMIHRPVQQQAFRLPDCGSSYIDAALTIPWDGCRGCTVGVELVAALCSVLLVVLFLHQAASCHIFLGELEVGGNVAFLMKVPQKANGNGI